MVWPFGWLATPTGIGRTVPWGGRLAPLAHIYIYICVYNHTVVGCAPCALGRGSPNPWSRSQSMPFDLAFVRRWYPQYGPPEAPMCGFLGGEHVYLSLYIYYVITPKPLPLPAGLHRASRSPAGTCEAILVMAKTQVLLGSPKATGSNAAAATIEATSSSSSSTSSSSSGASDSSSSSSSGASGSSSDAKPCSGCSGCSGCSPSSSSSCSPSSSPRRCASSPASADAQRPPERGLPPALPSRGLYRSSPPKPLQGARWEETPSLDAQDPQGKAQHDGFAAQPRHEHLKETLSPLGLPAVGPVGSPPGTDSLPLGLPAGGLVGSPLGRDSLPPVLSAAAPTGSPLGASLLRRLPVGAAAGTKNPGRPSFRNRRERLPLHIQLLSNHTNVYMCKHKYIYIYICIYVCIHIYIYMYIYVCVCVCVPDKGDGCLAPHPPKH